MSLLHLRNVYWDDVNNKLITVSKFRQETEISAGDGEGSTDLQGVIDANPILDKDNQIGCAGFILTIENAHAIRLESDDGDDYAFGKSQAEEGIDTHYEITVGNATDETSLKVTPTTATIHNKEIATINAADDFADDAAAATGGIAVGQTYHTAGTVKIRLA